MFARLCHNSLIFSPYRRRHRPMLLTCVVAGIEFQLGFHYRNCWHRLCKQFKETPLYRKPRTLGVDIKRLETNFNHIGQSPIVNLYYYTMALCMKTEWPHQAWATCFEMQKNQINLICRNNLAFFNFQFLESTILQISCYKLTELWPRTMIFSPKYP